MYIKPFQRPQNSVKRFGFLLIFMRQCEDGTRHAFTKCAIIRLCASRCTFHFMRFCHHCAHFARLAKAMSIKYFMHSSPHYARRRRFRGWHFSLGQGLIFISTECKSFSIGASYRMNWRFFSMLLALRFISSGEAWSSAQNWQASLSRRRQVNYFLFRSIIYHASPRIYNSHRTLPLTTSIRHDSRRDDTRDRLRVI